MAQTITTAIHRISPSRFVRTVARTKATALTAVVAVSLVAALIAGITVNNAFYIAVPAILLVVFPAVISMIFFYYALSPAAAMLTLPHVFTFDNDNINITYFEPDFNNDKDIDMNEIPVRKRVTFPTDSIMASILQSDILITPCNRPGEIVAIVPFDTFGSPENLMSAMHYLNIKPTANISL